MLCATLCAHRGAVFVTSSTITLVGEYMRHMYTGSKTSLWKWPGQTISLAKQVKWPHLSLKEWRSTALPCVNKGHPNYVWTSSNNYHTLFSFQSTRNYFLLRKQINKKSYPAEMIRKEILSSLGGWMLHCLGQAVYAFGPQRRNRSKRDRVMETGCKRLYLSWATEDGRICLALSWRRLENLKLHMMWWTLGSFRLESASLLFRDSVCWWVTST